MAGETKQETKVDGDTEGASDGQKRERSSIAFPYQDLNAALEVAKAIHDNVGAGSCTLDQLAAWLRLSAKSSGLRLQISTARMFGLIEGEGTYSLTQLGRRIVDPNQVRKAKAEAFLNIPLYRAVFDKYRGGVLPPAAALERDMALLGVAEKQKDRARQVFERSAEQANFFEHGRDRLVEPAVKEGTAEGGPGEGEKRDHTGGGGGGDSKIGLNLDPLLIELLKKIPPTEEGWPAAKRIRWFRTFAMNVSEIYDADGEPVELKIEAEKGEN